MNNKKAWLRIFEALIAVLIIFGTVLVMMSREDIKVDTNKVYEKQRQILDIIVEDNELREKIINNQNEDVNNAISKLIPLTWNFTTNICGIDEICNSGTPNDREVYVIEKLVTSTLTKYEPKKIRFFVWMK